MVTSNVRHLPYISLRTTDKFLNRHPTSVYWWVSIWNGMSNCFLGLGWRMVVHVLNLVSELEFDQLPLSIVPLILLDSTGTVPSKKETWQQGETNRILCSNRWGFSFLLRQFYLRCNTLLCWHWNDARLLSLMVIILVFGISTLSRISCE